MAQSGGQHGPTDEEKERMRLRIGITKEQQDQIEAIYAETHRQKHEISARMNELNRQLYRIYDDYDFDRSQALAIRKEIMSLHKRTLLLFADNEEKLRRILNREQFAKMRALMREMWEKRRREFEKNHPRPHP